MRRGEPGGAPTPLLTSFITERISLRTSVSVRASPITPAIREAEVERGLDRLGVKVFHSVSGVASRSGLSLCRYLTARCRSSGCSRKKPNPLLQEGHRRARIFPVWWSWSTHKCGVGWLHNLQRPSCSLTKASYCSKDRLYFCFKCERKETLRRKWIDFLRALIFSLWR